MEARARGLLLAVAAGAVVASASVPFWNWHPDEATYVQVALESRAGGSWLDATYFGQPSFLKPTLLYAAMRGSFAVVGDSVLAARLPGLLCLLLCAALVFRWARRHAGPRAGLVGAVTVLLSPLALRFGHLAMMDVPLAACFLGAAVVGRDAHAGATGARPLAGLVVATAGTLLLKGPALLPLVVAAFLLEAGRAGWRVRWGLALLGGVLLGSSWMALSYARHGAVFLDAFFGRENLGKFAAPWSAWHVVGLLGGVVLCALPYRVWPVHFFGGAAMPRFARWFPVVALAFYALPSVTFTQYMVCVLPAVALGVGVLGSRTPGRWVVAHVVGAAVVLLGGAAVTAAATSGPGVRCRGLEVVGDKPGMYWLWLRRADGEVARCVLRRGPCEGEAVRVPRQVVGVEEVVAAVRAGSLAPVSEAWCLERGG